MLLYTLLFSMKAKLCLHVVKQALNNYVNVAVMQTAVQIGLPDWVSSWCVGGSSQNKCVPVNILYVHVGTGYVHLKWGKTYLHSISFPLKPLSVLRVLFCDMQSVFSCKSQIQNAFTQILVAHINTHVRPLKQPFFSHLSAIIYWNRPKTTPSKKRFLRYSWDVGLGCVHHKSFNQDNDIL